MVTRRRLPLPFDAWHLLLVPLALVMLLPFLWMVVTSLETPAQTLRFPPTLWPGTPQFENYPEALRNSQFGTWFLNSIIVTSVIVLSNLVLCSLAATRSRGSSSWAAA